MGTGIEEPRAARATKEDLCRMALDHYDKIATKEGEWFSSIPRAIKQYYESDSERQRLQSAVANCAIRARKANEPIRKLLDDGGMPVSIKSVDTEIYAAVNAASEVDIQFRQAVEALIAFEAEHKMGE